MFRSISNAQRSACILLVGAGMSCLSLVSVIAQEVAPTKYAALGDGQVQAYVSSVSLPADGLWMGKATELDDSIRELYLVPAESTRIRQLGKRMYAAIEKKEVERNRWTVRMGFESFRRFAQDNNGTGPASIADFGDAKQYAYVSKNWNKRYQVTDELAQVIGKKQIDGPFVHLIPNVRFAFAEPKPEPNADPNANAKVRLSVPQQDSVPLAFALRPIIDDGKHWVLYTDGRTQRVDIDKELVRTNNAKIRPLIQRDDVKAAREQPMVEYKLVMVSSGPIDTPIELSAFNQILDESRTVKWDLGSSSKAEYSALRDIISGARMSSWKTYASRSGGVLRTWGQTNATRGNPRPRRSLSTFSILGGRAAIEETLQLQNLVTTKSDKAGMVDVDSLQGVKVKSHPFKKMLGNEPGGQLELARYVPADRFFVYVGKPESIGAMLDKGAPFIATIGTSLSKNCLNYNLESRYLARLGMNRDWVDAVLKSGLTSELAAFTPDLLFIDGTDLTVIAKLRQPEILAKLVGLLGVSGLNDDSVLELPTTTGRPAYIALRDELLFVSTNRGELESSIELHTHGGSGSLGDSTEFRYMLTQLPVNRQTRAYAYLSDPFVRRLVGPRVKIGQRRRVLAKAKMEALTGRALLARLDGYESSETFESDVQQNYLPGDWQSENMSVSVDGMVRSSEYGTLRHMRSLQDVPLDQISPEEAESYERYVENYSRYWRRFFDPIAVRLDEVEQDQLELSTFILPLVDNSIYNQLREMLVHQDDNVPLAVPIVQPKPVVQFSMNLKERAWQMLAGNFSEFFRRYSGASSAMLDDFGPSVHVAVFDADPIIAVGSGDVFGAFGGNQIGGGSTMLMAPVLLSMLTRPCSIMVETKSPERTAQYLRQAALAGRLGERRDFDFATSFYQVENRDQWVWTMDLFGIAKLRYGVEVVDQYLVIRNIPWSSEDQVVSTEPVALNAAMLTANPSACRKQLPGLFASAADANRQAVMSGLGRLYPFMLSGATSVEEATVQHQRLFGFYPKQFAGDEWTWGDFQMVSKQYGSPLQQRQPSFDPAQPFGMLNQIDFVQLNMQFEQDGLRSTVRSIEFVRWRLR